MVSRLLQLVNHGHSIVLDGDVTCACSGIDDEVVLAKTKLTYACVLLVELAGRREEHPVEMADEGPIRAWGRGMPSDCRGYCTGDDAAWEEAAWDDQGTIG